MTWEFPRKGYDGCDRYMWARDREAGSTAWERRIESKSSCITKGLSGTASEELGFILKAVGSHWTCGLGRSDMHGRKMPRACTPLSWGHHTSLLWEITRSLWKKWALHPWWLAGKGKKNLLAYYLGLLLNLIFRPFLKNSLRQLLRDLGWKTEFCVDSILLCDLGKITSLLCAAVSSSVK
jgi:hypothetical protein